MRPTPFAAAALALFLAACGDGGPDAELDRLSRIARLPSVVQHRSDHLRSTARLCLPPGYAGEEEALSAIDAAFDPARMLADARATLASGYPFESNHELLAELSTPQNQAIADRQLAALRAASERLAGFETGSLSSERLRSVERYVAVSHVAERTRAYLEATCPGVGAALRRLAYSVEQRAKAVCDQQMQTSPVATLHVAAYQLSELDDAQLESMLATVETVAFARHAEALEDALIAAARVGIERLAQRVRPLDATR